RGAAHRQVADRLGHRVAVMAGHVLHREGQLALVEQFQRLPGPQDRADMVVTVEVEGGIHRRILPARGYSTANWARQPSATHTRPASQPQLRPYSHGEPESCFTMLTPCPTVVPQLRRLRSRDSQVNRRGPAGKPASASPISNSPLQPRETRISLRPRSQLSPRRHGARDSSRSSRTGAPRNITGQLSTRAPRDSQRTTWRVTAVAAGGARNCARQLR